MNSLIAILVDKSSSMNNPPTNPRATADGYNIFVNTQKLRADDCVFWSGVFDTYMHPVQEFIPLADAYHWGGGSDNARSTFTYYTGGYTNLFGRTSELIKKIRTHVATLPKDERPISTTVVIQTDGEEACSGPDYDAVTKDIEEAKAEGWRFIYLAAGSRAADTGMNMGFDRKWMVTYQPGEQAKDVFERASIAILEELVAPGSGTGI